MNSEGTYEEIICGRFSHDNKEYQLLVCNNDNEDIPHYYLTNEARDFFCGFKITEDNSLEYYTKDKHNLIVNDNALLEDMVSCLESFSCVAFKKCTISQIIAGMWEALNPEIFRKVK